MGEYPTESIVPMPNQVMPPNMKMSGDAYHRGLPIFQHPAPSMMVPSSNLRASHIPSQQPMYNQLPGQMPMDVLPQQSKILVNVIFC